MSELPEVGVDSPALEDIADLHLVDTPMPPLPGALAALARWSAQWWWPISIVEWIASAVLLVELSIGLGCIIGSVIGRATGAWSFLWITQMGTWLLTITAFLGGAIGYRRRRYPTMNWWQSLLRPSQLHLVENVRDCVTLVFGLVLTIAGWHYTLGGIGYTDPEFKVSDFLLYMWLPICGLLIVLFSLERILVTSKTSAANRAFGVIVTSALVGIVFLIHYTLLSTASDAPSMICVAVVSVVMMSFGTPLPLALGTAGLLFCYFTGATLDLATSTLTDSMSGFELVAIPFFLLTGFIMSAGKLSDFLAHAVRAVLRRVPGGLLHMIVVSMFIFSGVSGSKVGDMAAVGRTATRMAEEEHYDVAEAVAALCAGGAMGDTIPPSVGLIILASISLLSVGALFLGGTLPAVAVAIALLASIWLRYRRRPTTHHGVTGWARIKVVIEALPVLAIPVILIGGIVSGIATATEISAIAVIVALVMVGALYRSISLRNLGTVAIQASVLSGVVLFTVATASLFGRVMTLADVPQDIASFVGSGHVGKWGFFAISGVVLVFMGMVMEGLPAILVFAPLLIPIAAQYGVDPIQYGIFVIMAIGIGTHTPPLGIALYTGAVIGNVEVREVNRRIWSYMIPLYAGLVIVAVVPQIVTWLPSLAHIAN